MASKYIKITEYCAHQKIDNAFIFELEKEGIIRIVRQETCEMLDEKDLAAIEMFGRWHYELGINMEGIDAMRHMVERMKAMQQEIKALQHKLAFYT